MKLEKIDAGAAFDFGRVSAGYADYRDIYPQTLYQTLYTLGIGREGQKILDLGSGTGVLPRHLYAGGAAFAVTDVSENQQRWKKWSFAFAGLRKRALRTAALMP